VNEVTGVKAAVNNHLVPRGEGFAAELAAVGPRVRVDPLVLTQQVPPLEVLRTERALERPGQHRDS
jgi:hypothetical protein